MDSVREKKYFQKLEGLIHDAEEIVTIPRLANVLNVSMNCSLHLLSKYVEDQRKLKPSELSLTYVLTGFLKDKKMASTLVKEDGLAEKKATFDIIRGEMLFSVQKCKQIDFNALALVDDVTRATEAPLLGSIVSKNCVKRALKVKKLPSPPPTTTKGKSSFFLPKTESSSNIEKSTEPSVTKSEPKPKQNGIASMFVKAATQTNKEKANPDKKPFTTNSKPKGGLTAFLSKGSSTSNSSIRSENSLKKEESTTSYSQPSELEELMEVDFQEFDEEIDNTIKKETGDNEKHIEVEVAEEKKKYAKPEVEEEKKKDTKKKERKVRNSKNKRQREKSEEKVVKKRKRIVERNDSESDDLFENDDDVIEKSDDEPERAPSPVTKKPLAPKNKIRKAVDKTYMDEEGYIVTKTEYVYESAPEDDEVPVNTEKVEKPKLEKKTSASSENDVSPTKGAKGKKGKKNNMQNQPTLMNFFKKK